MSTSPQLTKPIETPSSPKQPTEKEIGQILHDINGQLTIIVGSIELLDGSEYDIQCFTGITTAQNKIRELINNLKPLGETGNSIAKHIEPDINILEILTSLPDQMEDKPKLIKYVINQITKKVHQIQKERRRKTQKVELSQEEIDAIFETRK